MNAIKIKIKLSLAALTMTLILPACSDDDGDGPNTALFPSAAFTASATQIESGTSVTFTDNSTNTPTLWTWDMPGAIPGYSNQPNPTVEYPGQGTFDVTLTVRNEFGADEIVMEKFIEVTAPPVIDLEIEPQVRLQFEDNLENEGLVAVDATSAGALAFEVRPGGGNAFTFNGSNALTLEGYTGINGAGTRSVALWLKSTNAATRGLVHWGASGPLSRSSFKLQNTGVIRFEYQGGGDNGVTVVNDGEWHHVAYTYDGSTVTLYVDGNVDLTASNVEINTGNTGETDVNIGSQLGGSIYEGAMDDVRIFTEVLTAEQVKILSEIK